MRQQVAQGTNHGKRIDSEESESERENSEGGIVFNLSFRFLTSCLN